MAKKRLNKVLTFVSGLLSVLVVTAQELPLLPVDDAVKTEVFPDGMTCYVSANPYVKGFADYAVVRRSDREVVLRWEDVITGCTTQTDSVLLAMVRTVAGSGMPADYGVFACGDLDADEVMKKLRYMSLMVDAGDVPGKLGYPCGKPTEIVFGEVCDTLRGIATVTASWDSPRTPEHLMNTVQKAVYDKAVYELGYVACGRLRGRLKQAGIAASAVDMNHRGSLDGLGNEEFEICVRVGQADASAASVILREVLAGIDAYGAYASELRLAEAAYLDHLSVLAGDRSNDACMDRCISAYLYNAPLASPEALIGYHKSKEISDGLRESVFLKIVSALLEMESETVSRPSERTPGLVDTLALPGMAPKVALRGFRKDPMSGGTVWTFSNGFQVVYKNMPTEGVMYYSLAVNGGYGSIEGMEQDGGICMSGYLDSCHVSGIEAASFVDMLRLAGISMNAEINFSNVMISGQSEGGNVELLMKSLLAVANERSLGDCPEGSSAAKVHELFEKAASAMNDGVLVLVSDMDESRLRKILYSYVGGFRTRKTALRHVNVNDSYAGDGPVVDIGADGLTVRKSSPLLLTVDNCVAADVAAVVLECVLVRALAPSGLDVELSHTLRIYPADRYSVTVDISRKDGGEMDAALVRDIRSALSDASRTAVGPELLSAAKAYVRHHRTWEMTLPSYWLHAIALRYLDGKDFTTGYDAKAEAMTSDRVTAILHSLDF